MLQQWLDDGILDDPNGEFMVHSVENSPSIAWEEHFVVRPEHVLQGGYFATQPTRDRILPTGRYWQALHHRNGRRHATKRDPLKSMTLTYRTHPSKVAAYVHEKYLEASRGLCHLLRVDYDLLGTLQLIKRYYLLDQGDFFVNFMDSAEADLVLPADQLSVGRLQHWLGLSVHLTEHGSDDNVTSPTTPQDGKPVAHELRCRLAPYGLMDRLDRLHRDTGGIDTSNPATPQRLIYGNSEDSHIMTGVDLFCIELPRIPSPLNLVLSPGHMNDYQLLFRSLFFAKHVERRLVSVWRDHLALKELPALRGSMGRTFLLRQRMLHCLQHLIYYMMFEVIEPNWSEFVQKINLPSAQTVDDILLLHTQFLQRTLEACLITNRDLLSKLMRLMRTCLLFADQMNLFMKSIGIHEDRHTLALEKQKRIQQSLHDYEASRRHHRKGLREALRKDYVDRQQRTKEHTRRVEREVTLSTYTIMINRHEEVFTQQLREFMNLLSKDDDLYHTQKVNLCLSLDYNGFANITP
jgi:gamma-tubulin complex component 2